MSSTAIGARLRPAAGAVGRALAALGRHPGRALATLVAAQIGLALALFASVAHNGWLTYQGGDQLWLVTSGWLVGQGTIPPAVVGPGWPVILAPLTWLTGSSSLALLPLTTVLQVGILGPIGTLAVYDIGSRIAGRLAGLWCAAVAVVAPYLVTPLFVDRYEERWTDQILVQATGFTQLADFPSTVILLVAAALVLRSVTSGATPEALVAGSLAGLAIAVKPANALFLAGPALAYLLARQWRRAMVFALALVPAILTVAVWKQRGLGTLPVLALDEVRLAASTTVSALPLTGSYLDRAFDLDVWLRNMSNLREFFWSARVAQWIPFAGALAVARVSRPAAGLLFGWVMAFFLVKGSSEVASIENASFWRLVMPALPGYVLLAAATPLLVPTLPRRLGPRIAPLAPRRRVSRRTAIVSAVAIGAVPLAAVLAASPLRGTEHAVVVNEILVPVDASVVSLDLSREGATRRLRWTDSTSTATTFYRVLRTGGSEPDARCERRGADRCELNMNVLATTRERTWVDPDPVPGATYRIGVAANWLDDPEQGDVFIVSPPVRTAP